MSVFTPSIPETRPRVSGTGGQPVSRNSAVQAGSLLSENLLFSGTAFKFLYKKDNMINMERLSGHRWTDTGSFALVHGRWLSLWLAPRSHCPIIRLWRHAMAVAMAVAIARCHDPTQTSRSVQACAAYCMCWLYWIDLGFVISVLN